MQAVSKKIALLRDRQVDLDIRVRAYVRARLGKDIQQIPSSDFIDAQFDVAGAPRPERFIALLSTPRSGSTLVSDVLYQAGIGIPHEYFQSSQYAKLCAARWSVPTHAASGLPVKWEQYADALLKNRTTRNGVFACNIHASHINAFNASKIDHARDFEYVVIFRRNLIAQSISYSAASQDMTWSSNYSDHGRRRYCFTHILRKARQLEWQYDQMRAFADAHSLRELFVYEDIAKDLPAEISRVLGLARDQVPVPRIEKQRASTKNEFLDRFRADTKRYGLQRIVTEMELRHRQVERDLSGIANQT